MNQINDKIMYLWEIEFREVTNGRMPLLFPKLRTDGILFIGANPSFSPKAFRSILSGTKYENINVDQFYSFPKSDLFDIEISIEIEKLAKNKYSYFEKFRNISNHINLEWDHIDIFFLRETNQKKLRRLVFEKGEHLNDFGKAQIRLSKELVQLAKPRIIIVANALASRLFENYFGAKFNEFLGCHVVQISEKETPVFLTSMLTGQHALDNFSYKRLCWHIKKVTSGNRWIAPTKKSDLV